jgi:LysM repeat protein
MPLFVAVIGTAIALIAITDGVGDVNSFAGIHRLTQEVAPSTALQQASTSQASEPTASPPAVEPQEASTANVVVEPSGPEPTPASKPAGGSETPQSMCLDEDGSGLFCIYTVQPGDTLWGIATALGLAGTPEFSASQLLAMSNGLGNTETVFIRPGDEMLVPLAPGVLHRMRPSEGLSHLAAGYGASIAEIMSANRIAEADMVLEGTILLIPSPLRAPTSDVFTASYLDTDEIDVTTAVAITEDENDPGQSSDSIGSPASTAAADSSAQEPDRELEEGSEMTAVLASEGDEARNDSEEKTDTPSHEESEQFAAMLAATESTDSNGLANESEDSESEPAPSLDSSGEEDEPVSRARSSDDDPREEEEQEPRDTQRAPTPQREEDNEVAGRTTNAAPAEATSTPSPTRTAASTPSATPTQTPTPTPSPTSAPQVEATASIATIKNEFSIGYRSIGGSESNLTHILERVIPCESSYNVRAYNPAGPYYGLMQFVEETWIRSGGGDWYDARQQGANTARLLQAARPETQWPHCWLK